MISQGAGPVVILIGIGALALCVETHDLLTRAGLAEQPAAQLAFAAAAVVAAFVIWFTARAIAGRPRRVFDPDTGRDVFVTRNAGSLFFIPTRYWAFIALGLAVLFWAAGGRMEPPPHPAVKTAPIIVQPVPSGASQSW